MFRHWHTPVYVLWALPLSVSGQSSRLDTLAVVIPVQLGLWLALWLAPRWSLCFISPPCLQSDLVAICSRDDQTPASDLELPVALAVECSLLWVSPCLIFSSHSHLCSISCSQQNFQFSKYWLDLSLTEMWFPEYFACLTISVVHLAFGKKSQQSKAFQFIYCCISSIWQKK